VPQPQSAGADERCPGGLVSQLRRALRLAGAALVGFADLGPVPAEVRLGMPRAVSIVVARDPWVVAALRDGPSRATEDEFCHQEGLLRQLKETAAHTLEAYGYRAATHLAPQYHVDACTLTSPLPHKTAATRAGLGWIGRCSVLVTEAYGSAVRMTTVLTDAPVPVGVPTVESGCGGCRACIDACPAQAVAGGEWRPGVPRQSLLDALACRDAGEALSRSRGLDRNQCGYCVAWCRKTERYLRSCGALGG